jgi:hypothetical protein
MTRAFFEGVDAAGLQGLLVTDGTPAGTHEITNISGAYSGGLFPPPINPDFTVFHGRVLFVGDYTDIYDTTGLGLWETNGTAAGTHEIFSLPSGGLTVFDNEVLFTGVDAAGNGRNFCADNRDHLSRELAPLFCFTAGGRPRRRSFLSHASSVIEKFMG